MTEEEGLRAKLINVQSKAFEMLSQLAEERDNVIHLNKNYEAIINQIVDILGLEQPKVADIFSCLHELKGKVSIPSTAE